MTYCVVVCETCTTEDGLPRRWRYLCEDCAQDRADGHRTESGHTTTLTVVPEPSMSDLQPQLESVKWFDW